MPRLLLAFGVLAATMVGLLPGRPALAAPGDATPQISKIGSPPETTPGGTITYTINYTCSNNNNTPPVDGCDGAVIRDPLPTFTDIYGNVVPVTFVSAPGTTVFPSFSVIDGVVTGQAGAWAPGVAGAVTITVQVPKGVVPVGVTTLTNVANVTDADKGESFRQDTQPVQTIVRVDPPTWTISKLGPTTNTRMNRDYEWTVSVCGPATSALWPIYDITDTLPPGFQFVSAQHGGTYTDDGAPADNVSDGAGTITWRFDVNNRPPLESGGCFRTRITGRFPSGYVDPNPTNPANDDNVGGAHKINSVAGVGSDGAGATQDMGPAPWESVLTAPVFGSAGTDKRFSDTQNGDNFYVTAGDTGVFNLSATIDSDFPLDYAVLTDGRWDFQTPPASGGGLPDSFTPTQIDPGTWNSDITAQLQGSTDGTTWTDIGAPVASDAPNVIVPLGARYVRWVWGAPNGPDVVPGNFQATGQQIIGTLGGGHGFGLYTNYSQFHVERDGVPPQADVEDSDQYILEVPNPLARIDKSVANPNRLPGQSTTYTITVRNNVDATGPLVNPEVTDCIPQHFNLQGSPTLGAGWAPGATTPCQTIGPDGQPHPGTPLRFVYSGILQPGQAAPAITYNVQVSPSSPGPVAPFGSYVNTAFVQPSGGGSFQHCANTSPVCGDTATVTVPPTVELASRKCVSGALDAGIFRPNPDCEAADPAQTIAQTLPGNRILWRLQLENVGNTSANNIDFIDIFPYVGDTAVIATGANGQLNPRGSEFTPILTTPITAPAGWTVYYSTSSNPCRPEVGGPTTNCDAPNWTTTPDPLALPTYRSIKLHYNDVLDFGEPASFTWEMRAPVTHSTYDQNGDENPDPYEFLDNTDGDCGAFVPATDPTHCPRAVNSFAYGADATNTGNVPPPGRLFAEPPQVEVRVTDPPPGHAIGDRVWFDKNFDGIQSANTADEPGIAGIKVELLDAGGSVIDTTFTDANGNYLFSGTDGQGLPTGTYSVRFTKPAGWHVSPADAAGAPGADDGTPNDSDVPRVGTDLGDGVSSHTTPPVQLGDAGPSELDLTWDMGLWYPQPAVDVVKVTKDTDWPDSAAGDGRVIMAGRPIQWIYTVTNTGNSRLQNVTLTDNGGPDPTFTVSDCQIVTQGANADGLLSSANAPIALNRGAVMRCTATSTAGNVNYSNVATVSGVPYTDDGQPTGSGPVGRPPVPAQVTDTDPSSYISGKYDLALAKTVGTLDLATGSVTFTIAVRNEGNVDSGNYVITDVLPDGVSPVTVTPPAATTVPQPDGTTVMTWNLSGLAPNGNQSITIDAHVDDYLVRPYRNYAEISDDSAELVTTQGVPTPPDDGDFDSDPDADITNDQPNGTEAGNGYGPIGTPDPTVDNGNITEAGSDNTNTGDDANDGEDDADIADIAPTITYDLALAKVTPSATLPLNAQPSFTVRVYNQGNVPSGEVVVRDQIPLGLTFAAAGSTPGCVPDAGDATQVLCTIANIQPGAFVDLALATTINTIDIGGNDVADYSTAPWRNWAEIDSDSGVELYNVPDGDSQPEDIEGDTIGGPDDDTLPGDPYTGVPTADPTYSGSTTGDEDDNDDALVDTGVAYDLALAKTAAAPDLAAGTVQFTITIANQGTVDSGDYTVTDLLPVGLTLQADSATPAPVNAAANPLTWNMPNLAPGAETQIMYIAEITDFTARPYRNFAEISDDSARELYNLPDRDSTPDANPDNDDTPDVYDTPGVDNTGPDAIDQAGVDPDPEDDADIADVNLDIEYDLALAKTGELTPPTASTPGTIAYTVTVENQGNVPSGAYTVVDTLPAGVEPVESTLGSGDYDDVARTITWTVLSSGSLMPGAQETFTFVVTIVDVNDGTYRNFAEIADDSSDTLYDLPEGDADSDPDTDTTNDGNYDEVGVDRDNSSIDEAGEGADTSDDADIADVTLDLALAYDLALAKTVTPALPVLVAPDGEITFTVTVLNEGFLNSRGFVVADALPEGLTPGTPIASVGTVSPIDPVTRGFTWTVTEDDGLDPGDDATLTITATIADITLRPYTNQAEITDDDAETYGPTVEDHDSDPDPDHDTTNDGPADNTGIGEAGDGPDVENDDADIAPVDVNVDYDLALLKLGPATLDPSGLVTFTIRVQNQGNVDSGPYTVTDEIPAGMAFDSASDGGALGGGGVRWTDLANLEPGAEKELTVTFTITDYSQRPFLNFAEITADSSDLYDAVNGPVVNDTDSTPGDDLTNNYDSTELAEDDLEGDESPTAFDDEDIAVLDPEIRYDMELVKTVQPAVVTVGSSATFTITVFNNGNVPSGPVTVNDVVPAGLTATAASNGGAVNGDGTVVWTVEVPAQQTLVLTVDVTVSDITQRPFRNVAEITADGADLYDQEGIDVEDADSVPDPDHDPNNDGPNDNTEIGEATAETDGNDDADPAVLDGEVDYDLALIKRLPGGQRFKLGDVIRFEVLVANQGDVASGLYTVQDVLPAGLSYVSASDGGTAAGGVVTWTGLPSLAPGEQKLLTVEVRMDDTSQPSYINVAEITDDSSETYSAPGDPVTDVDSTPDGDPNNDPYADTDDISTTPAGDEDDHDRALLDPGQVAVDNLSPVPPTQPTSPPTTIPDPGELPRTGGNNTPIALIAGGLLLAGVALVFVRRRAPRRQA